MNDIARALGRALVSQFHPRMLWLAVWPFLIALVVWGIAGFAFRHVAVDWLVTSVGDTTIGSGIRSSLAAIGFDGGLGLLMTVVYFALDFAAMVLTALLIIATVAMPSVVAFVGGRDYPALARKQGGSYLGSLVNALWVGVVFVIGFLLTLPLWLIAPLAIIVPLLWWGWATSRMFRYDALVAHASGEERSTLFLRHGRAFFAIGTIVSMLNFVPPLFFLVPILGGLAFTHYGLEALARLRAERGESGMVPAATSRARVVKRFGLVIVGDEILSGRRLDKHLTKVIELLTARGLELSWAHYVGDDRPSIAAVLTRTFAGDDVVFVTGGIGATPDDQTRQAAAQARGVEVALHPEAERLIHARIVTMNAESANPLPMDSPEHRQRMRMGEFPVGASVIPNPYNQIPGFSLDDHHFVPGFPVMAWPMLEWVLETRYADQFHRAPRAERSVLVFDQPESRVTPLMEQIEAAFAEVRVFSLPSVGDPKAATSDDPRIAARAERHIELGVKGPTGVIDAAFMALQSGLQRLDARFVMAD